jgi:hypothetical protein
MDEQRAPYGSLAQQSRKKSLGTAKGILWFVGLLTLAVYTFMFVNVEKEVDKAVDAELKKQGSSLRDERAGPPEERVEFEEAYAEAVRHARLIYGASAFLGLVFIACALMVERKPVPATVTGLVLYLGSLAAGLAIDPSSAVKGIIIKVLIIAGLISAVKAALAIERSERATVGT